MRGAPVIEYCSFGSATRASQTFLPLFAFTAIRRPSMVPQMILPSA